MNIGFTGTRRGMTPSQQRELRTILTTQGGPFVGHHGDCIGADDTFHWEVAHLQMPIVIHPPIDEAHRAFCSGGGEYRERKTHFARNRDIVDECDMLIATPWQTERPAPKTGGGTWYTIEYAEKQGKPVTIIWPNGTVERLTERAK